jgi:hypothetical protein
MSHEFIGNELKIQGEQNADYPPARNLMQAAVLIVSKDSRLFVLDSKGH